MALLWKVLEPWRKTWVTEGGPWGFMVRLPFLLFLSFWTMAAVWEAISPSSARTSSLWWAIPSDCGPSPFCLKLRLWGTTMKKIHCYLWVWKLCGTRSTPPVWASSTHWEHGQNKRREGGESRLLLTPAASRHTSMLPVHRLLNSRAYRGIFLPPILGCSQARTKLQPWGSCPPA